MFLQEGIKQHDTGHGRTTAFETEGGGEGQNTQSKAAWPKPPFKAGNENGVYPRMAD